MNSTLTAAGARRLTSKNWKLRIRGAAAFLLMAGVFFFGTVSLVLAQEGAPAGGAPAGGAPAAQPPGAMGMLLPFILMFAVIYFLMIRPQQKKMKEHQQMVSALQQGDEVITSAGILGTVRGITDKVVTLEVSDNVKIKVLKSQVSTVVKGQLKDA